jgi:hypothetical protein
MCDFISFLIDQKGNTFVGKFNSHNGIWTPRDRSLYREGEWTSRYGTDYLYIRTDDDDPHEKKEKFYIALVKGQYKTREEFIKAHSTGKWISDTWLLPKEQHQLTHIKLFKDSISYRNIWGSSCAGHMRVFAKDSKFQEITKIEFVSYDLLNSVTIGEGGKNSLWSIIKYQRRAFIDTFGHPAKWSELHKEVREALASVGIKYDGKKKKLYLVKK